MGEYLEKERKNKKNKRKKAKKNTEGGGSSVVHKLIVTSKSTSILVGPQS
jgi:hypothetical protein